MDSIHLETRHHSSEPFGELRACSEPVEGINLAKNLCRFESQEILACSPICGTTQKYKGKVNCRMDADHLGG